MAYKIQVLQDILAEHFSLAHPEFAIPSPNKFLKSVHAEDMKEVYESLGGMGRKMPLSLPKPDYLSFKGLMVFWDSERHFNRYRALTLRAELYDGFPGFSLNSYRSYCRKHEKDCLKSATAGNNWSSPLSEKFFGQAEVPGDLGGNGAPQWKLRAFQDFLIDIAIKERSARSVRVAPWEELLFRGKRLQVSGILTSGGEAEREALGRYLQRRVEQAYPEK